MCGNIGPRGPGHKSAPLDNKRRRGLSRLPTVGDSTCAREGWQASGGA